MRGRPVLEDHHRCHHVGSLQVGDVVALDTQGRVLELEGVLDLLERDAASGEVAGPLRLVQREGLLRVAGDRFHQGPLVAALGHPQVDPGLTAIREPGAERVGIGGNGRHEYLAGHPVGGLGAVQLDEKALDQLTGVGVVCLVGDPAALAADAATTYVEHLHGDLELILRQRDDVGIRSVRKHDGVLLQRPFERLQVVAEPGRAFELELGGGRLHLAFDPLDVGHVVAGHELAEVVDDRAVLLGSHAPHTRCRALADVAQQARTPDLGCPLEHALGAGTGREHPQQQVERLADRPGMGVRTEVANALALGPPHHLQPRELLVEGDGEPGIALVVAVFDVEPRVVLLDPGVLELERLDLVVDDRPLDSGRVLHHRLRARVERGEILEVRTQPGPQALGLADVDDPTPAVGEAVDARCVWYRTRCRSIGRGICHFPEPRRLHRQPRGHVPAPERAGARARVISAEGDQADDLRRG